MKTSHPLRLILLLCASLLLHEASAQNYESDSIFYTPITKQAPAAVKRSVTVFRDTTKGRPTVAYYFDVSMGVLTGCNDCATGTEFTFSAATTHGVTLGRKTRVGAGVGFDTYYTWKTLPLFGAVSYDLIGTKNTHALFVEVQYGYAFAWHTFQPYEMRTEIDGGEMFAALAGYRVRYHNLRIALSAGFRQQSTTSMFETDSWYVNEKGAMVRGTPNRTTVQMDMGRAMLRLAFSWK
jgi:hypothetical protein